MHEADNRRFAIDYDQTEAAIDEEGWVCEILEVKITFIFA